MLLFKWIILIFIFVTISTLGFAFGDRYAKRVFYLRELMQSLKLLKTEVIILSNPLPIALKNISKKSDEKINEIYNFILQDLTSKNRDEIYLSFLETKDKLKNDCFLNIEDIDLFLNLGKVIGKTDRHDQDKHFTYIIEELALTMADAKIDRDKNQKMYRSLGILTGLGAIIILV